MENTTNTTNPTTNTTNQTPTISIDPKPIALDLRLRGFRYWIIAQKLQEAGFTTSEYTIESWFRKGGALEGEYTKRMQIRVQELKEKLEATEEKLQEVAMDGLTLIHDGMLRGYIHPEIAKAAQDILDRAGYAKQSKIEHSGKIESDSMTQMANAIKGVLEAKKPQPLPVIKDAVIVKPIVNANVNQQNGSK